MSTDPETSKTVSEWITHGVAGDEAACAALYHHFSPAVLRLAVGLLGDWHDAEEVTQDTFVYALRNLRRYDAARSAFSTWLYIIAVGRCRNKRRRKWPAVLPLEPLPASRAAAQGRQIEALLERRGVRLQVWRAIQALSPRLREAVVLRFVAEMRYREIGQALGCNPKTAESRVRLGVSAVRQALAAQGVQVADLWAAAEEQWA